MEIRKLFPPEIKIDIQELRRNETDLEGFSRSGWFVSDQGGNRAYRLHVRSDNFDAARQVERAGGSIGYSLDAALHFLFPTNLVKPLHAFSSLGQEIISVLPLVEGLEVKTKSVINRRRVV